MFCVCVSDWSGSLIRHGNEGVLRIPQSPCITGTSPLDCLVSYPGYWLEAVSYPSVEKQSVYSTASSK